MKIKDLLAIPFAAYLFVCIPLIAQKAPSDEVGFNAQKVYDVHDIDSVNLFNGNLTVTLPIGRRFTVGPALSYQLMLIYNGRIYDIETYDCEDPQGNLTICEDGFPTRQSNAGVAWRVSLGRLLAPHDVTANRSSFDRDDFIYEGPAGDEHSFPSDFDDANVILSDDPQPLRLIKVPGLEVPTREVEFPSGEIHRFQQLGGPAKDEQYGVWHLVSIRDRFSNSVSVNALYGNVDGTYRETAWLISDSGGRSHRVNFVYHSQLDDTWNRGMSVSSIVLDGFEGVDTTYTFNYSSGSMPTLQSVALPDATSYAFEYGTMYFLTKVTLPTRGSVAYTYQSYTFANEDVCANGPAGTDNVLTMGIKTRTVNDGVSSRVWDYVQRRGPKVLVAYDNPPCYNWDGSYAIEYGPFYWVRTSVLAPADAAGTRVRSDHYFSLFHEPPYPDTNDHPLAGVYHSPFGFPGVAGRPSDSRAKGALALIIGNEGPEYPVDVSGSDGTGERALASRVYAGCDATGDCTNGALLRSTYVRHGCLDDGVLYNPNKCWVTSTRTVFEDDLGCGEACYRQETISGRTGGGFHSDSATVSNFPVAGATCSSSLPCAETIAERTHITYAPWPSADRLDASRAWITGTFTEQSRTEGAQTSRSEHQFSPTTGTLEAMRVLKGTTRGPDDILMSFTYDARGNVTQERSYGGDDGGLVTNACCTLPVTGLDYLVRKTYDANNFLTKAEYLGFCTDGSQGGCVSILTTLDRTIDRWTGLTTSTRDSAGVETNFGYDAFGRLKTVSPSSGASRSYDYVAATPTSNARVTEAVSGASGSLLGTSTFEFDGLGRVRRTSTPLPGDMLGCLQTDYDAHGRAHRVSQPVERTTHPMGSIGTYWTTFGYDALGRQVSVTAPDGAVTSFAYVGARTTTRTTNVATSTSASSSNWTAASTIEHYDALGRLRRVDEAAGGTTSAVNPVGTITSTHYTYDVGGRLTSVKDGSSTQERLFVYDGRGFLTTETHPENGPTNYVKYDARGHALQRTGGGKTLKFFYDAAERLIGVADITATEKPMKAFSFAIANDGANLQAGKLTAATRYNYLPSAGNVEVKETYAYNSPSGQMSRRTTLVESVVGSSRSTMQQYSYGVTYDDLLLPKTVTWPDCAANGCHTADGLTSVTQARSAGYVTSVGSFADLSYHPTGMVKTVVHKSTPTATDSYSATSGLSRPSMITFSGGWSGCGASIGSAITASATVCAGSAGNIASVAPRDGITHSWAISGGVITSGTAGDTVTFTAGATGVVTLSVTATDACNATATNSKTIEISAASIAPVISAPSSVCGGTTGNSASIPSQPGVEWSITGGMITSSPTAASVTFTAGASGSVILTVTVTNACNSGTSSSKTIPITRTPTATLTGPTTAIAGSAIQINVALTGSVPWRLEWSDGYVQSNISTSSVARSVSPSATTTYDVLVSSSACVGTSNGPLVVTVIPPSPSIVAATTQQNRDVLVTWTPVAGASGYRIERTTRTGGAASFAVTVSGAVNSFSDVVPATIATTTYIYYVRTIDAVGELSQRGSWDHATAATALYAQTQISAGVTLVLASDIAELRGAIDALRYAVYLSPAFNTSPAPAGPITAADLTALMTALTQARAAAGSSAFAYAGVPPPTPGGTVLGAHITQLREALR